MGSSAERGLFRALRHRNFRLFLAGQLLSLPGSWMQQVALGWLVYRLTQSPWLLGLVGFFSQFPALVVAPLAGVWADRTSRHRLILATQSAGMVQALVLAALVLSGQITVGWVLALSAFLGVVNGIDLPARQAFLIEMVDGREDLPNAIALNSSTFNASRMIGPAIAGLLIAAVGEGLVFLINALSYAAVIAALLAMRIAPVAPHAGAPPVLAHLRDGLRYAFGVPAIRAAILIAAAVSLVGFPFTVLMPVVATDVLGGGPDTLGFLLGATGLGSLTGAFYLARRASARGLGRVIRAGGALMGAALLGLALAPGAGFAIAACYAAGTGMMVLRASCNTVLQTLADDDKRGRVMSLYAVAFMGMMPLGSLAAGALASRLGAPATIAIAGAATIGAAIGFGRALGEPHATTIPSPAPGDLDPIRRT